MTFSIFSNLSLQNASIAVIGLGYVGLPLAVEFGRQRRVIGYDVNSARVDELRKGSDRTRECTSDELKSAKLLSYSSMRMTLVTAVSS